MWNRFIINIIYLNNRRIFAFWEIIQSLRFQEGNPQKNVADQFLPEFHLSDIKVQFAYNDTQLSEKNRAVSNLCLSFNVRPCFKLYLNISAAIRWILHICSLTHRRRFAKGQRSYSRPHQLTGTFALFCYKFNMNFFFEKSLNEVIIKDAS